MGCRSRITVGVGMFLLPYLLWIFVLVFWYRLLECLRGNVGWSFPGGFVDMCISLFLCFSSVVVGLVPHCGCEYLLRPARPDDLMVSCVLVPVLNICLSRAK